MPHPHSDEDIRMTNRRDFLAAAVATPLAGGAESAAEPAAPPPSRILREALPLNLETPLPRLGATTATADHFVRSHFPAPSVDPATWRLRVEGAVQKPLELTLADLAKLPTSTRRITLECAGNSRVYLTPKVRGVNWSHGAVSTAEWSGVALGAVLDLAIPTGNAVEVVLEGADSGVVLDEPRSPGPISYARSIPLAKARRPECLLASRMNSEPLSVQHGAPLRALVGGWYGMASVKWLTRIIVVDRPFDGFWQTMDYSQFDRVAGVPTLAPITAMRVKSVITSPVDGQRWSDGVIRGVAWAGEHAVAHVDVSLDGGANWIRATLAGPSRPLEWVEWSASVKPPRGAIRLMARAVDAAGQSQPLTRDPDRRTYQINHVIPVDVVVE